MTLGDYAFFTTKIVGSSPRCFIKFKTGGSYILTGYKNQKYKLTDSIKPKAKRRSNILPKTQRLEKTLMLKIAKPYIMARLPMIKNLVISQLSQLPRGIEHNFSEERQVLLGS